MNKNFYGAVLQAAFNEGAYLDGNKRLKYYGCYD